MNGLRPKLAEYRPSASSSCGGYTGRLGTGAAGFHKAFLTLKLAAVTVAALA
jgi:hypothetical protein